MDTFDKRNHRGVKGEERDGVIYEPGFYAEDRGEGKNYAGVQNRGRIFYEPASRPPRASGVSKPRGTKRQAPQKSQFALFYILTLLAGVVVCIVIFAIVFTSITQNRPPAENAAGDTVPQRLPMEAESVPMGEHTEIVGVLTEIDALASKVKLIDVNSEKEFSAAIDGVTQMKNAYAQEMSFAEFNAGDIVNASFDTKSGVLRSMVIDASAWKFKLIKGVEVDTNAYVMTIGSTRYVYDDMLTALYRGKPTLLADIAPIDLVTVSGYKDKVWFIEVNKSHGFVELLNKEKVQDGTLEVDTTIFMPLEDVSKLEVHEGAHKVVVKGLNMEPFVKNVVISQGRTEIIDLSEIQYKSGVISVVANVTDYKLYINKKEYPTNAPIVLDMGTYSVEARKDGYLPFESFIQVTEPTMDVPIVMTEEVVLRDLSVTTVPEDAAVYINNGYVGRSPVTEALTDGKHTVTVRKEGYNDATITVDVGENARLSYSITMQPTDPYALSVTTPATTPITMPTPAPAQTTAPITTPITMSTPAPSYAPAPTAESNSQTAADDAVSGQADEGEQTSAPLFESPLY